MSAAALDRDYARAARLAQRLQRLAPWALASPALAITLLFFALPGLYMFRMSFNLHESQRIYVPAFSFENYVRLLTESNYLQSLGQTIVLAFVTAVLVVAIGYFFALFVWLRRPSTRLVFIALALCPLLISEISIIFGWWMFFPRNGLLSFLLVETGLVADKISVMYTVFAAVVGLVYISLPFCFFVLLSIFDGIDRRLVEASGDLGATPFTTFREVLLPLSRGGIVVAFAQAFIWTMGTYATPSALGPDWLWTVGFEVYRQMGSYRNWPLASALAVFLVLAVLAVMVLSRSLAAKRTEYHA